MVELTRYRKTAPVRAVQVTEENVEEIAEEYHQVEIHHEPLTVTGGRDGPTKAWVFVATLEGEVKAPVEEHPYFCRGPNEDAWLVKASIFERTYEEDPA